MTRPATLTLIPEPVLVRNIYSARAMHDGEPELCPDMSGDFITICRTCSDWDGDDLLRPVLHPCPTWTALQTHTTPTPDPWMEKP